MVFQALNMLLWFLPVGGFILLLYLLKIKRRDVRVPAVFLWPPITTDVRANTLFQRLRPNLLLFLQLLIVLLTLLALARPLRKSHGLLGRATVIVIDASGSMGATDVSPSRFEVARRRVETLLRSMSPQDQLALIEAGAETRVAASLTSDKKRLQDALRNLRLSDAPNNIGDALRLAAALVGNRQGSRIVLISDGSFPEIADFSPGKAKFIYEAIGSSSENVAITAMEMEQVARGREVFVALKNFGKKPARGVLSFLVEGALVDAREIEIAPGALRGETLLVTPHVRQVEAQLEVRDHLESDNHAILIGSGMKPIRALLVGAGNFFLERALALEPHLVLDKAPGVPETERAEKPGAGVYDLVIFDGVPPVPVKAPAILLIATTTAEAPVQIATPPSELRNPPVLTWERDHPLLRYVTMEGVLIDRAQKVEVRPWGKTLVESKEGPLMVAGQNRGKKWLYLAWNLLESDFPLRPGFPIFVANALRWLTGERSAEQGFTLKAGAPFSLSLPGKETQLTLRTPEGRSIPLEVLEGSVVVHHADKVGLYELRGRQVKIPFAVNLLNQDESNIAPRTLLQIGGRTVVAKGEGFTLRELWKPFALLALLVLMLEWWVFIRSS